MTATTAQTCPECSGRLQADDCETVCTECGLVVDEHAIDPGPEWRSFADDDTDPSPNHAFRECRERVNGAPVRSGSVSSSAKERHFGPAWGCENGNQQPMSDDELHALEPAEALEMYITERREQDGIADRAEYPVTSGDVCRLVP